MGAGQSADDEALRAEILNRLHGNPKKEESKEGLLPYLAREMKERALLGKDIISDANVKTIGKAALHQLGTFANMAKNNAQLRRERKILRELVEEKRRARNTTRAKEFIQDRRDALQNRMNDMSRAVEIAKTKIVDPDSAAEMQRAFNEEQRIRQAKAQEVMRQRAVRDKAGKREKRRTSWDSEDTKNLAYGGPWGLIASAVRHKRQNDINDLEDEYKQLEEQGYGRFARGKRVKPGHHPVTHTPPSSLPFKGMLLHPDEIENEMKRQRRQLLNDKVFGNDELMAKMAEWRRRRAQEEWRIKRPGLGGRPRIRPAPADAQSSPSSAAVDPGVVNNLRKQREEFKYTNGI